jgi:hypothetical protein
MSVHGYFTIDLGLGDKDEAARKVAAYLWETGFVNDSQAWVNDDLVPYPWASGLELLSVEEVTQEVYDNQLKVFEGQHCWENLFEVGGFIDLRGDECNPSFVGCKWLVHFLMSRVRI